MSKARTNFTDNQRAELYRLDRATCSFSGRSLWIVDYGMDPSYAIDWADHIVPASKGGPSELDNGATASWLYNYVRGDAPNPLYLFRRGQPTVDFLWHYGLVPETTARNLLRFAALRPSDWFLNRALWHLWLACFTEYEVATGEKRSRKKQYYTRASTKALEKWRKRRDREGTSSIEDRGLTPQNPEPDQELLLSARELSTQKQLLELVRGMLDPFAQTFELLDTVSDAETLSDLENVREIEAKYKDIPKRIAARILAMTHQLERVLPATLESA